MALFKCMCVFLVSLLLALTFTNAQEEASQRTLPPFPCIPGQPRPPWLRPCPLPPSECYTSLSGLMPCADFLTHIGVPPAPPTSACCDGLRSLVTDAPICLCHIVNGDINKLLPAPMIPVRMVALPRLCAIPFPRATLRQCIRGHVPPMDPPPPPSTPPEASPPEPPSTPPASSPPESPSTPPATSPPESPPTPPTSSPPSSPPAASPPESPPTPPAAAPPEPPAAPPPEPLSTPPPESPSTPPPTPAAAPPESPSDPPPATPPESPTDPPPTAAATPPATPSPSS